MVWPNTFSSSLGLVPASCVVATANIDGTCRAARYGSPQCSLTSIGVAGEDVSRPYTPVSPANAPGYVEFVVKSYGDKGKMSTYLNSLKPGDTIKLKGPYQKVGCLRCQVVRLRSLRLIA